MPDPTPPADEYEDVLHDQALVVALAASDLSGELFEHFREHSLLPPGEELSTCMELARRARPVLQRLALRAYMLGIDRGEARGRAEREP